MLANLPQNVRNPASRNQKIAQAVGQHESDKKQRLFERAFAFAFRGLVYAQIWEDPVVDMEALDIQSDSHVITIASGGCNVLSYLVADPAKIIAVDLNTAHIALNKLKCEAVRQLPDHDQLHAFFAEADRADNIARYREYIQAVLDDTTRRYWEGRDFSGRRRIGGFEKGLYRRGLLGGFIGIAHLLAKIYRVDPVKILAANSLDEQRAIFDTQMAPIFDRKFVRWLTDQPPSLFGLGIPPAQFDALAGSEKMADVLRKRLEKLACGFDLKDNYFAWQAFGRGYGKQPEAPLPPYLQKANYEAVKSRVDRIEVDHANLSSDWRRALTKALIAISCSMPRTG
jgi:S-adenosylmethionine-diacylglycerol 3-amino-3-carboxypropyl transferase